MPELKEIVINTGPLLALIAGLGTLDRIAHLFNKIIVPQEVCKEIEENNPAKFGIKEFTKADWLNKIENPIEIAEYLARVLDKGEASVMQTAINRKINTVCIDETAGRRVARLAGLSITGSLGIILRLKQMDRAVSVTDIIFRMREKGIYLSESLIEGVLKIAGERPDAR